MRASKTTIAFYVGLLLLLIASRVFTSIYYIEDFDSLNFASGVIEFNLKANQPHFPGYPVFIFVVKLFYAITGSFSLAFSLIGGLALFFILVASARLFHVDLMSRYGFVFIFLFFFNPAFWLMGNRYMPDLGGVAFVLVAFVLFQEKRYNIFLLLCGVLAGWRFSYLPIVVVPVLFSLKDLEWKIWPILWGLAGVLIWFLPMIIILGWEDLTFAALRQVDGHFNDFGGSVITEPDYLNRFVCFVENIWAFGLGGWWTGRHWITVVIGAGTLMGFVWGCGKSDRWPRWLSYSLLFYFLWVFLFQNVLYKSRHELPFLPFILVGVYFGVLLIIKYARWWGFVLMGLYAVSLSFLTTKLAIQHRNNFSTFAQLTEVVRDKPSNTVLYSDQLLIDFLSRQGIVLNYKVVGKDAWQYQKGVLVVGEYGDVFERKPQQSVVFYHNRYVNKMHEMLTLYVY